MVVLQESLKSFKKYYLGFLCIDWLRFVHTPDCANLTKSHDFFGWNHCSPGFSGCIENAKIIIMKSFILLVRINYIPASYK